MQDLHLNTHKSNRYSYKNECLSVIGKIESFVKKYRDKGYAVHGISLGDLVDRDKKTRYEYTAVQQQLELLLSIFDKFYLNFGNHEITYYKNNPIYSFMKTIQNDHMKKIYPQLVCEGVFNKILTPDRIVLRNSEIVFRGFRTGTDFIAEKEKNNILLLHDTMLSIGGASRLQALGEYVPTNQIADVRKADYIMVGHMHSIIDKWSIGKSTVYNLGCLLRTSVAEIVDVERQRDIVFLLVDENDNLTDIKFETMNLHLRSDIINFKTLEKGQTKRIEYKQRIQLKEQSELPNLTINDPVQKAQEVITNMNNKEQIEIFNKLKQSSIPIWGLNNGTTN